MSFSRFALFFGAVCTTTGIAAAGRPGTPECDSLTGAAGGICTSWYAARCDADAMTTACSRLDAAFTRATGGAIVAPWRGFPSMIWDDFSTPGAPETLTVSSSSWGTFERELEHDLTATTGTLRGFRVRHGGDGATRSQTGTIGGGAMTYAYTSTSGAYTENFFELQYDNASGVTSIGGTPFDLTGGGAYDSLVFHFDTLSATTTYSRPDGSTGTGARVCLFINGEGTYFTYVGDYLIAGGSACSGPLVSGGSDVQVVFDLVNDFEKDVPYSCWYVAEGYFTIEEWETYYGSYYGPYETVCDTVPTLADFASIASWHVYVDGADAAVLSKITLEDRN